MGVLDEAFVGSWAVAAGLVTRWELRHNFVRVFPDVYMRKGGSLDAGGMARAAAHWAKGDGVLIGCSAAAMHNTRWLDADQPAEIARGGHCRPPCGIRAIRSVIEPSECCEVDGFTVTTPARTAFDLGRRLPRERATPILDALCAATGLEPGEVATLASKHPGARFLNRLRTTLAVVDPGAESPPETHTRLLLIDNGLPRPTTQLVIRDHYGEFIARVDLGWRKWQVAVEYDGAQHWTNPTQRTKDIDRIARIEAQGWRVIRLNATLLHHRPHVILDRIRTALTTQGARLDG
ncbi:endonuclease domain-containing protein [Nocardia sp. NPDC004278]